MILNDRQMAMLDRAADLLEQADALQQTALSAGPDAEDIHYMIADVIDRISEIMMVSDIAEELGDV